MAPDYEIQLSELRDTVWIHAPDGSTVARFGRFGVDLHNSVSDQLAGASECKLCTHGSTGPEEWQLFCEKALEWWGVAVPADAIDPRWHRTSAAPRDAGSGH